jgi:hypothetical protein
MNYFGSTSPTRAAMIASPMRKSRISVAGSIDRVPPARLVTELIKSRGRFEAIWFDVR